MNNRRISSLSLVATATTILCIIIICLVKEVQSLLFVQQPKASRQQRHRCSVRIFNTNGDVNKKINDEANEDFSEEEEQDLSDFVVINPSSGQSVNNGYSLSTTTTTNFNGYSMTSGYSRFLDEKGGCNRDDMNEDGYADMMKSDESFWKRAIRLPIKIGKKILSRGETTEPGTLILVRHGESLWNRNKTFTGWADPDLTEQGRREMDHAARLLMERGYEIDVVFTSRLKRAIRSTWILLQELNEVYVPVFKSWRLNERFYGALTGLSKKQTAERLGEELVQEWRGSLRSRPPALTENHQYYPGRDRKYADLTKEQIPLTESLLDCMERTIPLWENKIVNELQQGRNVLVVAHANVSKRNFQYMDYVFITEIFSRNSFDVFKRNFTQTLRGLVKTIDNIGDDEIQDIAIPTGIPIVYKFEKEANGQLKPCSPTKEENSVSQVYMNGQFLEKPGLLKEALKREDEWRLNVPGYDSTMGRHPRPMTNLERSLYKLNAERELEEWASEFIDLNAVSEDDGNDGNFGRPIALTEDEVWAKGMEELQNGAQFDPDAPQFHAAENATLGRDISFQPSMLLELDGDVDEEISPNFFAQPCVTSIPAFQYGVNGSPAPVRPDPVIVIIRHGKTQHNKLGKSSTRVVCNFLD
jgi:2,3-bisphosphoglycerate-dependent phosphoglycerate mutase